MMSTNTNNLTMIKKVEDIVERIHNLDLVIKPKKWGDRGMADWVWSTMQSLKDGKDHNGIDEEAAFSFMKAYEMALTRGIIETGDGLIKKYKETQEENISLRETIKTKDAEVALLKKRLAHCNGKIDEFEKKYLPTDTFTGDVLDNE